MRIDKRILAFLALAILAAAVWLFLPDGRTWEVANHPSNGTGIVAFGDSLITGVGSESGGGFVSMLSRDLGVPIVNLGRSGDTTGDGLARIDEIWEHDPKLVIVLLGGNDFLRKTPSEQTFGNLDEIARRIEEKGSMVLILGIQGGILNDGYESSFESLAKRRRTGYVENVLEGVVFDRSLMSDSIHPNDKGYRVIADKVRPEIEELLRP